jgi:hypothetical protein
MGKTCTFSYTYPSLSVFSATISMVYDRHNLTQNQVAVRSCWFESGQGHQASGALIWDKCPSPKFAREVCGPGGTGRRAALKMLFPRGASVRFREPAARSKRRAQCSLS